MFEIKFSGDNFDQVRTKIQEFAVAHLSAKFGGVELKNGEVHELRMAPATETQEPRTEDFHAQSEEQAEKRQKRKPGRQPGFSPKKKEELEAGAIKPEIKPTPVPTSTPTPAPRPVAVPPPVPKLEPLLTKDDCTKSLQRVWDKFGMEKCVECLGKFGVKRVSELTSNQFPEFIRVCDLAVG